MPEYVAEMILAEGTTEEAAFLLQRGLEEQGHEVRIYDCAAPIVKWESRLNGDRASDKQLWLAGTLLTAVLGLSAKQKVCEAAPHEVLQAQALSARARCLLDDGSVSKQQISTIIGALKEAKADLFFFETGNVAVDN